MFFAVAGQGLPVGFAKVRSGLLAMLVSIEKRQMALALIAIDHDGRKYVGFSRPTSSRALSPPGALRTSTTLLWLDEAFRLKSLTRRRPPPPSPSSSQP